MNTITKKEITTEESFRFDIYKGAVAADGRFEKLRIAGHAYLRSGNHAYKVKLFTLTKDRFIVVPDEKNPDAYKIMTKEEVTIKDKGKRTYWNVVGEASVMPLAGMMRLKFDLFEEALFMNTYPSNSGNVVAFQSLANWKTA